jgi:hypothetical protein
MYKFHREVRQNLVFFGTILIIIGILFAYGSTINNKQVAKTKPIANISISEAERFLVNMRKEKSNVYVDDVALWYTKVNSTERKKLLTYFDTDTPEKKKFIANIMEIAEFMDINPNIYKIFEKERYNIKNFLYSYENDYQKESGSSFYSFMYAIKTIQKEGKKEGSEVKYVVNKDGKITTFILVLDSNNPNTVVSLSTINDAIEKNSSISSK